MNQTTIGAVREFIQENFLFSDSAADLSNTASLLEAGLIDSTGVLELVAFLERDFGLTIADADIVPENLDTIAAIVAFVERKRTPLLALAK